MGNRNQQPMLTLIKVTLISFLVAFLVSSCSHSKHFTKAQKHASSSRILSSHQTHALLTKWAAAGYQSLPGHTISHTSHHPLALKNKFLEIKSGYAIKPLTRRTKGIGLATTIKTKTKDKHTFSPITKDAFLSNIHSANIVATRSTRNGTPSTHIDIYDPSTSTHQQQALAYQPKIVIDYLNSLPGNSSLDIMGLIQPKKYDYFKGFYLTEPYDREKIPIVMIHGLASSPDAFMDLSEAIKADPKLRKKYQFFYYFYPTGTPWIVSASEFRKSYRALIKKLDPDKNDANIRKTVLMGHSMGGLIARLSLSHPGETLHQAYLGDLPPNTIFTKAEHKRIHDYFHFQPLTEPARVIYLATPHRGSRIADGAIGWVTIKLITIPSFILKQTADALTPGHRDRPGIPERARKLLTTGESSVDQLKPSNPSLIALNQMPARKGLTSYSIIGDIGQPLLKLGTDGVVSYHSAHINHSKSEHIVPANHDICDEKETIQVVLEILRSE